MLTQEKRQEIKNYISHKKTEMRNKYSLQDNGFSLKEIILLRRFNQDKNLSTSFPNITTPKDKIFFMSIVELGRAVA